MRALLIHLVTFSSEIRSSTGEDPPSGFKTPSWVAPSRPPHGEEPVTYVLSLVDFGSCRGIVTADVLVLGLSRGAIVTRKLKGVNGTRNTRVYTGSAPYDEGKSLRPS